jgi:cyclic beta-1,2-glucan synthetase
VEGGYGKIKIKTPLPALDSRHGWLPYQALACRMMGAAAFSVRRRVGFRDQLQDAVNLMLLDTAFARTQILQSCSRQYFAGDVMHWWHETEKGVYGVRTRCSDDLLWLVWAVCEYIEATGDTAFLGENAPFLVSEPLGSDERDRYETALISAESASVLIHCKRAVDAVFGPRDRQPRPAENRTGDWNDGYDAVGASGPGRERMADMVFLPHG